MVIVIEGPDAAGKTTLAINLGYALHLRIQHSEGPEKWPGEIDERIRRYLKMENFIFDRHPCISNPIYSGNPINEQLMAEFMNTEPVFIYCRGNFMDRHVVKEHDSPDHLKKIHDQNDQIRKAYDDWGLENAHIIFRPGHSSIDQITDWFFDPVRDIEEFHRKFGLDYNHLPRELPLDLKDFRTQFMQEELDEYSNGSNLETKMDSLIDLVYVTLGTSYLHGFLFREGWNRVHHANMKKVRAQSVDQSKRGSTFDIVKPEGWGPPYLTDLL